MSQISQKQNFPILIALISAYTIYAITCVVLKSNPATATYAGLLLTCGDTTLDLIIIFFSFWLWKNAPAKTKGPFGFFTLAFVFVTIPNALYQLLFNTFQFNVPYFSADKMQLVIHHTLFAICILFEFAVWLTIFINLFSTNPKSRVYKIIIFSLIAIIIATVFFWKIDQTSLFSIIKYFEAYVMSFHLIIFILAMFCLAVCKSKGLFYLSLGYLIIVGADSIMEFGFMSQHLGTGSIFDTSWFLGLLLVLYGLVNFKKSGDYKKPLSDWALKPNSIKAQSAFWGFILCSASLCIFLITNGSFSQTNIFANELLARNIPPALIIYAIFTIAASNFFARKFYAPISRIENKITTFINNKTIKDGKLNEITTNEISELQYLDGFLSKAFALANDKLIAEQKKHDAEQELITVAKEAAHDILSPVTALRFALDGIPNMSNEQRDAVNRIENSITQIAKELMHKYNAIKNRKNISTNLNPSSISSVINAVYEQKKYILKDSQIKLIKYIEPETEKFLSLFNPDTLERILSNIINNAKNAIDVTNRTDGSIYLALEKQGKNMAITISDNGSGMPEEVLAKIGKEEFSTDKENGHGIGLYSAIKTIASWNGTYSIDTNPNKGTQFTIYLPII